MLLYLFIKRMMKLTVIIIEKYHWCSLHTKLYAIPLSQVEVF